MVELLRVSYETPNGNKLNGIFIRTIRGYVPILIDKNTILAQENKIISEEVVDPEDIGKTELFIK